MSYTDDQIDAWEAQYGEGSLSVVPVPEVGEDFELVVRPLSYAEFREFVNPSQGAGARNAQIQAMFRAALSPSRSEINQALGVLAGLPARATKELQRMAGAEEESWRRMDGMSDEELVELGISAETAADLRGRYPHPGQLLVCTLAAIGVVLVVKRPTSACTTKLVDGYKEAFFDASTDAAAECCVWPAPERVQQIFRQYPAIPPCVLFAKLCELARGEAGQSAKKLVRKGRRSGT